MQLTDILKTEHRVIEIVIACLERIAGEASQSGKLNRDAAEKVIDFIRNFADRCHHGKEEDHLFTSLESAGMPTEGGPVGVMLREHQMGREFVRQMSEAIPAAGEGISEAVKAYATAAMGYAALLRAHIQKEDNILFPAAENLLSQSELDALRVQFDLTEREHMGEGTHERYLALARDLAIEYGVPHQQLEKLLGQGSCCCSHEAKG